MVYDPSSTHVLTVEDKEKLVRLTTRLDELHTLIYQRCVYDSRTQTQLAICEEVVKEIKRLLKITRE